MAIYNNLSIVSEVSVMQLGARKSIVPLRDSIVKIETEVDNIGAALTAPATIGNPVPVPNSILLHDGVAGKYPEYVSMSMLASLLQQYMIPTTFPTTAVGTPAGLADGTVINIYDAGTNTNYPGIVVAGNVEYWGDTWAA